MNVRNILLGVCCLGVCGLSACGTAESDATEQNDALLSWPVPIGLRLTTIKMNGHSNNPSMQVNAYVTLPGLPLTRVYLGDYAPQSAPNINQFNCSKLGKVPGADGYCTANLPLQSTIGSTKLTGTYPAGSNSQPASIRINGTNINFTIDSAGHSSQTCASAWMMINNIIDGDKITICWQTTMAIPYISHPLLETVFYPAPGEMSSVGLAQTNMVTQKTAYGYTEGTSSTADFTFSVGGKSVAYNLTIQDGTTFGASQSVTSGSSSGYSLPSKSLLPDPDQNTYYIITGAHASSLNFQDGSKPSVVTDLASGKVWALTLGQLKGLAQNPPDASSINPGDQMAALQAIPRDVAQMFVAQDPFSAVSPIGVTLNAQPQRFIAANPSRLTWPSGLSASTQQITGSSTDRWLGQSTGDVFHFLSYGWDSSMSITETLINMNQSTSTMTLQTGNACITGTVDLYMDTSFGTIVPVPHLVDTCNAPTNNCKNAPASTHVLLSGQSLAPGQVLTSCNGLWTLSFQPDGMLVERYIDGSIATSFWTPGATAAYMQTDGNFVVYDASGNPLAASGTQGNSGAFLILQDDGYLDIYNPGPSPAGGMGGALPAIWAMAPGG